LSRFVLFTMVFFSGAAGLVYQVVWHRYLTILLGAQARATAVVLAIFLGGISAGYITFGRWSRWKRWNLLLTYAAVEMGLAFWAFLFPEMFHFVFPLTSKLYSLLGMQSILIDIGISVVLIGFPTFLMGGTLPLLTQGLAKDLEEASQTHARIYGFNTVGACLGSLLAGYWLIPTFGLAITSMLAGMANALIAFGAYFLFAKYLKASRGDTAPLNQAAKPSFSLHTWILLAVGFFSGFYVLCLETVLIRIVGLCTGASDYNFTLIVSIFVFGLGLGSLLVRRIGRFSEAHLFWNQLAVSALLLLVYFSADHWPYWTHLVRIIFRDQVENFYLYHVALGLMYLAILAIPVSVCGLVLPLCFHLLKDRQETLGHRVGQLYGLNTVGSVLGAIVGGYLFLYFINLDHLFKVCIGITLIMLALSGYSYWALRRPAKGVFGMGVAAGALVLVGLFLAPPHAKENYVQPFRHQEPIAQSYLGSGIFRKFLETACQILFHKDGPNSTVIIGSQLTAGKENSRTIFINGKSDGNTQGDFHTMNLTGHIPALLARSLDRVAIIGMGTGITAGAVLSYDDLGAMDIIEISETLIRNAHYFDRYNGGVSVHPKVHFHQMDAFRFLGGTQNKYDLVISEPSNPWVSGVENLYALEFYDIAKRKLTEGGLYVQWLQGYAFEDRLVKMVLKTISSRFKYVTMFQMMSSDYALVASDKPIDVEDLRHSAERFQRNPRARDGLVRSGIAAFETVLAQEVIPNELIPAITEGVEPLELANPILSHEATKAFFVRSSVEIDRLRRFYKEYFPATESFLLRKYVPDLTKAPNLIGTFKATFCDNPVGKNTRLCTETFLLDQLSGSTVRGPASYPIVPPPAEKRQLKELIAPAKRTGTFTNLDLEEVGLTFGIYKKYHSPLSAFPYRPMIERTDYCLEKVGRGEELYGDCLLQKAAILEVADPKDELLLPVLNQYNDWFAFLPAASPNYSRYKAAKEILDKMIVQISSRKQPS
jgi:spermidine synthase